MLEMVVVTYDSLLALNEGKESAAGPAIDRLALFESNLALSKRWSAERQLTYVSRAATNTVRGGHWTRKYISWDPRLLKM